MVSLQVYCNMMQPATPGRTLVTKRHQCIVAVLPGNRLMVTGGLYQKNIENTAVEIASIV